MLEGFPVLRLDTAVACTGTDDFPLDPIFRNQSKFPISSALN